MNVIDDERSESLIEPFYVFIIACFLLSFVIAFKRAFTKRNKRVVKEREEVPGMVLRSGKQLGTCEKITKEEFSQQASLNTRQEVIKLVQSNDY
jgi:hypothetical protein